MPRDFLSDNENPVQSSEPSGRDFLMEPSENSAPKEGLGTSLKMALPRVAGDIAQGAGNFLKQLPGYYESAKTEVPGVFGTLKNHPGHAAMQALAGSQELINNLAQTPKALANYGANRLNLLPQGIVNFVNKMTPEDTTKSINALFEQPQYPGEALIRGAVRNAANIAGTGALAKTFNPLQLTAKNIAKDVINTAEKNKESYSNHYENLFKHASSQGLDDLSHVSPAIDLKTLRKYSPAKSIAGVEDFVKNPTLKNAHNAKSDLLRINRDLSKMTTLKTAERKQYKASTDAIDAIRENMFKDPDGKLNQRLADRYNLLQQGYAKEVIPYRNKAINSFKRGELSAKELVSSLSKGQFASQRGKYHPAIGLRNKILPLRNKILPLTAGAGLGSAAILGYNHSFGNTFSDK